MTEEETSHVHEFKWIAENYMTIPATDALAVTI